MNRLLVTTPLALLLSVVGLTAQISSKDVEITVEYDRQRDFSQYKTYHWMESVKPVENAANHIRLTRAIEEGMEKAGYTTDTDKPDVRILYQVATKKKIGATSSQKASSWDPTNLRTEIDFVRYEEGTLRIEIYDAQTNGRLWRATGTQVLGTPDRAEEMIREAVERLFEKYPSEPPERKKDY